MNNKSAEGKWSLMSATSRQNRAISVAAGE